MESRTWWQCGVCKTLLDSKSGVETHLEEVHQVTDINIELDGDANQGRGWRKVTFAEARIQLDLKEEGVKGQGVLGNEKNSLVEEIVVEDSDEESGLDLGEEDGVCEGINPGLESLENGDGDGFEDNDIAPGSSKAALLEEGAFIECVGERVSQTRVSLHKEIGDVHMEPVVEEENQLEDEEAQPPVTKKLRGRNYRYPLNYGVEIDENVKVIQEKTKKRRLDYLLKQSEYYAARLAAGGEVSTTSKRKVGRKRKSEKEEDFEIVSAMSSTNEDGTGGVTFTQSPTYIKNGTMRDYQVRGLNWLINLYDSGINGILADEMGLGKTIQTISLIGYLKFCRKVSGHYIVIVPKSTLANWIAEFGKWTPSIKTLCLIGDKAARKTILTEEFVNFINWDVLVTSYEMVTKELWALKKVNWEYLVMDEASRIKNEATQLAVMTRQLQTKHRLLLTGTPIQNNLHELWALLNFLLPDVFDSAENFDDYFNTESCFGDSSAVDRLHSILRPFLLRRIKADVEKSLLPKIELLVYVPLSQMQRTWYKNILMKDVQILNAVTGETSTTQLMNMLAHLRKCANHPYLFQGAEPGPPYTNDVHMIHNSGKLMVLDKLLLKLQIEGSRVLLFSQFTRTLDILDDYCFMRNFKYCRLDGSTAHEDRQIRINDFNAPGSDKFLFMLTTRAGGLGINLATADVVIIFDSDWNPQMDLQAMDRAHRIGQTKQVRVFRLISENTVEEKIIERAVMRLKLDHLVIQQGRLVEGEKKVQKGEMLNWIKYGANIILSGEGDSVTDETIEEILERSKLKAGQLDRDTSSNLRTLSVDGVGIGDAEEKSMQHFEGKDYRHVRQQKLKVEETFIELPKRRACQSTYSVEPTPTPRQPRNRQRRQILKLRDLKDFHFAPPKLRDILKRDAEPKTWSENWSDSEDSEERTAAEVEEKKELIAQTFLSWTEKDYTTFMDLMVQHGKENVALIAKTLNKSVNRVQKYCDVFFQRYRELKNGHRIMSLIQQGEASRQKKCDQSSYSYQGRLVSAVLSSKWSDIQIPYLKKTVSQYTVDADKFLISAWNRAGFRDEESVFLNIIEEIQNCTEFQGYTFFTSRSNVAIKKRCQILFHYFWYDILSKRETDRQQFLADVRDEFKPSVDGSI